MTLLNVLSVIVVRLHAQNQPLQRIPNGVNRNRLALIMAVLGKHGGLRLSSTNLFTNVVGGLNIVEPATDLAVAIAIASSFYEQPTPPSWAVVGEIGETSFAQGCGSFLILLIPTSAPM